MKWTFYSDYIQFITDQHICTRTPAWSGHRSFAYDLIRITKPNTIVELGTHYGCSFFTMCQAVKDGHLDSQCFAIDHWQGDQQSGHYGNQVYEFVSEFAKEHFSNIATLIRGSFDDALIHFKNESINLLHIDGYHTYQAVSHDFETWLPKIARNGIVLFHDTMTQQQDFGVHQFWNKIKTEYPSLEFYHSFGLGVLFPKGYDRFFADIFPLKNELASVYSQR